MSVQPGEEFLPLGAGESGAGVHQEWIVSGFDPVLGSIERTVELLAVGLDIGADG